MTKPINLVGEKYGRLTVLHRHENNDKYGYVQWMCQCSCGKFIVVNSNNLRTGHTKSCGCYNTEKRKENLPDNATHHLSRTRLYRIWTGMMSRCYRPSHKSYSDYGARGIRVCDEWQKPDNFFVWAKKSGYADNLSMDRIEVDGPYCPENCRWATNNEQALNRQNTVFINTEDGLVPLKELAKKKGIPYATVFWRLKNGFSEDRLFEPVDPHKPYERR